MRAAVVPLMTVPRNAVRIAITSTVLLLGVSYRGYMGILETGREATVVYRGYVRKRLLFLSSLVSQLAQL